MTSSLLEWSNSFQSDELKKRSLASVKQLQEKAGLSQAASDPSCESEFLESNFNFRERFEWNHQQVNEPGKIDCTYI